jgi:hemerythrin-like domain-containing protein
MAAEFGTRRRWLTGALGTAGLLVVPAAFAPALGQTEAPRPAAPARKTTAEGLVPATEDLMREHGVLDRVLLIYEAGIRRLGGGEDIEAVVFKQTSELMRDFVHEYHEKSEEELIFPRFKKAGRMVELVDALAAQHAEGRAFTQVILQNSAAANTTEKRNAMIEAMKGSIALYRPHTAREDTDLFPTLRSLMTPNEFEDLSAMMEKNEKDRFGADGFEKVAKRTEALEKKIGIHDLAQAKPKE